MIDLMIKVSQWKIWRPLLKRWRMTSMVDTVSQSCRDVGITSVIACSRRSDSGARNEKYRERRKNEKRLGRDVLSLLSPVSFRFCFLRSPSRAIIWTPGIGYIHCFKPRLICHLVTRRRWAFLFFCRLRFPSWKSSVFLPFVQKFFSNNFFYLVTWPVYCTNFIAYAVFISFLFVSIKPLWSLT